MPHRLPSPLRILNLSLAAIFALGLGLCHNAEAVFTVDKILTDSRILVASTEARPDILPGSVFSLFSHESGAVIGYAFVVRPESSQHLDRAWVAEIRTHNKSALIRPGNRALLLDLTRLNLDIPGRYDLQIPDRREISARYKPLVYMGFLAGNTASTLAKKEAIFGPGIFGYGLTDRLQVETIPAFLIRDVAALAGKFNLYRDDDHSISILAREYYFFDHKKTAQDFSLYVDTFSNSRFVSYLKIVFLSRRPDRIPFTTTGETTRATSEIQSTSGIVLNNWDKIIFGPKYNFVERNIGGHFGYLMIGDYLHFLLGLEASNFRNVKKFGKDGFAAYADIFIRW